jgi:hypothetical protein
VYLCISNSVQKDALNVLESAKNAADLSNQLREAAKLGNEERVKDLLENCRFNPDLEDPLYGRTALSLAAENG